MADLSLSASQFASGLSSRKRSRRNCNQGGLICDIFAALGKAERDGDGYRISGKWSFVSGVNYSDWVGVGVMIQFPDSPKPVYCLPMLKVSEVEVVNNWDTFGLRGQEVTRLLPKMYMSQWNGFYE